jgi:hypothetical protein
VQNDAAHAARSVFLAIVDSRIARMTAHCIVFVFRFTPSLL